MTRSGQQSGIFSGILIVGHGTRDPQGRRAFFDLVSQVAGRVDGTPIEPCFLEFARPTIAEGIARLAASGVRHVRVVPLMLFAAGHVRRDIPAAVGAAIAQYPEMDWVCSPHLGCCQPILQLSARRYQEGLAGRPSIPEQETLLLLVGRGSRDPRATREMSSFVELRWKATPVGRAQGCFCAMAEPLLKDVLPRVAAMPAGRIVVQPHLLFPGYLADGVRKAVDQFQDRFPSRDWVVIEPLGADHLLAEAVFQILNQSQERWQNV